MHRVDNSTAVTSLPTFQPVGTQGYFTSGNPQTGAEPTIVDQDIMNAIQEEIAHAIEGQGITLDKSNTHQLSAAIQQAATSSGVASFNNRTGVVTLSSADVSAVQGALTTGATFTGALNANAGLSVTGAFTAHTGATISGGQLTAAQQINAQGGVYLLNGIALSAADSGGTERNLLWLANNNYYALGATWTGAPGIMVFYPAISFIPGVETTWLGALSGGARWAAVAAVNGTIQTSDVALKRDVAPLPACLDLVARIDPITFRWKADQESAALDRTHWGFDADNVRDVVAETGVDFGGYIGPEHLTNEGAAAKSLNYSQLIAILWKAVQELAAAVAAK
jgi:hypothetical protein